MLTDNAGLAKTSQTPGKTQTINTLISAIGGTGDMPGHGYAKTYARYARIGMHLYRKYILNEIT